MQKKLPKSQTGDSQPPKGDQLSPKVEEKMRLFARHIIDEVVNNHKTKLNEMKST